MINKSLKYGTVAMALGGTVMLQGVVTGGMMSAEVYAQSYPSRPVRLVASDPGGGTDFVARLLSQALTPALGQQFVVENRGGSVVIPADVVARSPADGHTLLVFGNTFWLLPLLQNAPYDPLKDFAPVSQVVSSPNVLVVHPSLPVRTTKDLITLAKARPGKLNYASGLTGSTPHLAPELFKSMAGVDIARIPYKGAGPALTAVMGGQVDMMVAIAAAAAPHTASGRLRLLGVTSAQPSPLVPGVPTVAASGLPGYEAVSIIGVFAPAGTPPATLRTLSQEIRGVLAKPDVRERLAVSGAEPVGSTPEEFAATVRAEVQRLGKVIRDAGIKSE